jgi:hypothetical protein
MDSRTNHHGPREDRGEANVVDGEEAHRTMVDEVDGDEVMIRRL